MSYTLFSKQGPVDHLASVQGLDNLITFLQKLKAWGPLKDFLDDGETTDIPAVLKDITMYLPYATNPDVKATMLHMKDCLEKSSKWAGISE